MKKNIDLIPVDAKLCSWLLDKLLKDAPATDCAGELRAGLLRMLAGDVDTLLLSMSGEAVSAASLPSEELHIGKLEIYPKRRRVVMAGREISLTPIEYDILYFLAENRGEVFTKEQIYRAVWSEDYLLDDSNIMAFIRKLRKKIEPNPDAPTYILTIWGIGYKFADTPGT